MSVSLTIDDGHVEALHNSGRVLFEFEVDAYLTEEEAVDIVRCALEPYAQK